MSAVHGKSLLQLLLQLLAEAREQERGAYRGTRVPGEEMFRPGGRVRSAPPVGSGRRVMPVLGDSAGWEAYWRRHRRGNV